MSSHNRQSGFTLVELMITLIMVGVMTVTFYTFFHSSLFGYLNLQKDASSFAQLNSQSARIANVLRGTTDIVSADQNDLVVYAYFYPNDQYVSLLRYYIVTTGSGDKTVSADLTSMTSNPPIGTPITASKRTFTVIPNYYQKSGGTLFTYLSASGGALSTPISDLRSIKGITVNLATTVTTAGTDQELSVQVSLRNRKTNL